jgi:lysophospholipase L1-like esterase
MMKVNNNKMRLLCLSALAFAPLSIAHAQQAATTTPNLALKKPYVSSDRNPTSWHKGLTDGIWTSAPETTFGTGTSTTFPKYVTIDLERENSIGYIGVGVPAYGSTKTIQVSLSTDGTNFTEVASHVFTHKKQARHLFTIPTTTGRFVRLTYPDFYPNKVTYPPEQVFTTEVAVYAPGETPVLPTITVNPPVVPDEPSPRWNEDGDIVPSYLASHNARVDLIKQGGIDLLFVGDSITAGWTKETALWDKYFGAYKPANIGISGDRTQNVLWRVMNSELETINPKVVVLLIGTNNMRDNDASIVRGNQKIVAEIHRRLPNTKLLLLGIFPRDTGANHWARIKIKAINAELAKLDDGKKTRFLDIGKKFLDENDDISKEIMPDSLHLSSKGYQIWGDSMKPLLDEMMKN